MSLVEFLILLLVAAIIGAIGEALAGYSAGGCAMSIVVGFVGAIIGRWLPQALGLPLFITVNAGGVKFPIIWSIIGSALFVLALRLILGRRERVV
jgi:uncharacterized membrane protein YeaQ/YmgE (transglycosylase-associated protein family)